MCDRVYVNDKTVEEIETSVSYEENVGLQHEAVGSPYVSQNAAETLLVIHKSAVHMPNMPFINATDKIKLHVTLK